MGLTTTLRPPPPRHPLEIVPLGRLRGGQLELFGLGFPPLAHVLLVLWHPGREPAFSLVEGRILPGWAWEGEAADGWVVLWSLVSVGDPT